MHGLLDTPCLPYTQWILQEIGCCLEQLDDLILSFNCQQELSNEKVSEKENIIWVFVDKCI